MARRVLLIGMMGAGKTTVGRLVADRLGWPYIDSDDEVIRRTGRTVPEIFASDGEAAFRAQERGALAEAVTRPGPAVVSVAGGAVLDPESRHRLRRSGGVVWLRADVATLAARVGSGEGRPLLAGDARAALGLLYAERRPLYRALADCVIDVGRRAPGQVADMVVRAL